jgi:hypothetical protein
MWPAGHSLESRVIGDSMIVSLPVYTANDHRFPERDS